MIHDPTQLAAAPEHPLVPLSPRPLCGLDHVEAPLLPHVKGERVGALHLALCRTFRRVAGEGRHGAPEGHVLRRVGLQVGLELLRREVIPGRLCKHPRAQLLHHATQHGVPVFGRVQKQIGTQRIEHVPPRAPQPRLIPHHVCDAQCSMVAHLDVVGIAPSLELAEQ